MQCRKMLILVLKLCFPLFDFLKFNIAQIMIDLLFNLFPAAKHNSFDLNPLKTSFYFL